MSVNKEIAQKKVSKSLRKVKPEERAELLSDLQADAEKQVEEHKGKGRVPGEIIGSNKTSYTKEDLDKIYGICVFTPEETLPVTLQGVRYQLIEGVEMMCPSEIKVIYDRHRRSLRSGNNALPSSGFDSVTELGAGALSPEPTVSK